jgi:hypothetical protein
LGLYVEKGLPKNTAWSDFVFPMLSSSDHRTPTASLTVVAWVSKDGGAYATCTGTVAEVSGGYYQFDAAAGDMNGTALSFKFVATGADDTVVTLRTS